MCRAPGGRARAPGDDASGEPRLRESVLRGFRFRLRKRYFDCVGQDGTVFVGYAARGGIGPLPFHYHATLWRPPLGGGPSDYSVMPSPLPKLSVDGVAWRNPRLRLDGTWRSRERGPTRVLLDTSAIRVEWRCDVPSAVVDLRVGPDIEMSGHGYSEELVVSGDIRRLPIRELHWGRFISEAHHLVWIEWRGPLALTLLFEDGAEVADAVVSEGEVSYAGGRLHLSDPRSLRDERLGDSVFPGAGWAARLIPGSVAEWREEKWLSRGCLESSQGPPTEGWAIHERVMMP